MTQQTSGLVDACHEILAEIQRLTSNRQTPILVALDGGSGAGKSTLALMLERELDAALIPMDDFFAADIPDWEWNARSVEERARDVIDWRRLRVEALEPLLSGKPAKWHPFDFEAGLLEDGTYGMREGFVERDPAPVIILDGAYSARPELADLVDLAVLVDVPVDVRHRWLAAREDKGFLEHWHATWDQVEKHYFTHVRPRSSFDLVVSGSQLGATGQQVGA